MDVSGDAALNTFAGTKPPAESQHRRRHAKRDHVGDGIQLKPEITCSLCQAGNAPVKAVEDVTDTYQNGCVVPISPQCRDDAVIAAEDVPDGEQAWNDRETGLKS